MHRSRASRGGQNRQPSKVKTEGETVRKKQKPAIFQRRSRWYFHEKYPGEIVKSLRIEEGRPIPLLDTEVYEEIESAALSTVTEEVGD